MRLGLKQQAWLLLSTVLLGGCRTTLWTRPVIWLDSPDNGGTQINGDFTMSFSTMESCEGLTLQSQGVPRSPRWTLHLVPGAVSAGNSAVEPVQWTLAHAEDASVSFHQSARDLDESVRQVCALVKQQGRH